jgi:hypothetical protein
VLCSELYLNNNTLTGTIPSSLYTLSTLEYVAHAGSFVTDSVVCVLSE